MKKVIVCLLVVIMIVGIYGCASYGGEDKGVFEAMKKEGIIFLKEEKTLMKSLLLSKKHMVRKVI